MTTTLPKPSKRKSKTGIYMLVRKGFLEPADTYAVEALRNKGYHMNDLVSVIIRKPNNPAFHRLVHRIGQLCAENIDEFEGMDAHAILKRIQYEANIFCEEVPVLVDGRIAAMVRWPMSMDFESMDDGERHEMAQKICRWIAAKYWKTMTPEAIEEMAESFID